MATLDYFTPIVDDAYDWGRIAATNSLSDVYAMGGTPFLGLNIVNWPVDDLPMDLLQRVLQGGADAATAAGVAVVGGHSITDPEPKYGMVALGFVDPARMVTNAAARPGDHLYLTKPLGLGIISTAAKRGVASEDLIRVAVDVMTMTNAAAKDAMLAAGVRAATDVTGFGLMGHLHKMLLASGCAARVDAAAVAVIDGVGELARAGVVPGGTRRNHDFVRGATDWGDLSEAEQLVLADAQTSGGMLIAAPDPGATAGGASRAVAPRTRGRHDRRRPGRAHDGDGTPRAGIIHPLGSICRCNDHERVGRRLRERDRGAGAPRVP